MNQGRGPLRSAAGSSQCESVRAWSDSRQCSGGEGAVGERVPPSRTLNFFQFYFPHLIKKRYCVKKHWESTGKRSKYQLLPTFIALDRLVALKRPCLHFAFPKEDVNVIIVGMQGDRKWWSS